MTGIVLLVLAALSLIAIPIGLTIKKAGKDDSDMEMIGNVVKWIGVSCLLFFGFLFLTRCFVVIDAGEVGVQVMFGKVLDTTLTEGLSSKNPFAAVDKYNIQLRETTMDIKDNNALQALTSDKLAVLIDATIWWKILGKETQMIRRTISAEENDMDDVVVFPAVRSAVRDAAVYYTFDEIITKRAELSQRIDEILIKLTTGKGCIIEKVLIRNVVPEDKRVTASIGAKLQQQQELQAKEYELKKSTMDAKIRIQNAEGIAEAQKIIDKTLTPEYLKFEEIQMMKSLGHSPSNTFVFYEKAPTGQKGVGEKMVYTLGDFEKKK